MIANLCAYKYPKLYGNWAQMYCHVTLALCNLGYVVNRSPFIEAPSLQHMTTRGIVDNPDDLYIYNHTFLEELNQQGLTRSKNIIIIKPTAPTPLHFTMDTVGYAAASSITYDEPDYINYDSTSFFEKDVPKYIEDRQSKWSDRQDEFKFLNKELSLPDDHVLVIGQMPGDQTVTQMSFGNHWDKLCAIVEELKGTQPIVVKLHPTLKRESDNWAMYEQKIIQWRNEGVTVFEEFESLYDILPKTKVAIIENSTCGIECMMHDVPIISYGYPEYHWITKDLRHLSQLKMFVENLSWFDKHKSRSFIAWYCQQYQCYDYESTLRRLKKLLFRDV